MTLAAINLAVLDENGNALTDISVEVRAEIAGAPLVQVYADRDGLNPLGNPFAWADGKHVLFYVPQAFYKVTASKGALSRTWRDVAAFSEVPSGEIIDPSTVTEGPTYDMDEGDDIIYVDQTVGAPITINLVTAVGRQRPVKIVDGKGDASTNPITIVPAAGETILGASSYVINFDRGSITFSPHQDGKWFA